jgi:tripeptide aminopeptidase
MNLIDRFISYVKIDTQSDENSDQTPSTSKQFNLAKSWKRKTILVFRKSHLTIIAT